MNDLEIFINNLIKLNSKDELIINESNFFNNDDIKNIIKKYGFYKDKIDNFYELAAYIVKLKNMKLQKLKSLYNLKVIDNLIFDNLVSLDNKKIHYFCCLFMRYLNYNINYKELEKFINILQNLDVKRI